MTILHNLRELERIASTLPKQIYDKAHRDLKTIEEEYPPVEEQQADLYGPIVVFCNQDEQEELLNKIPVIRQLETEVEERVIINDDIYYLMNLYILTDSGIVVYMKCTKENANV